MQNQRKTIVINPKVQYQSAMMSAALIIISINIFLIAGSLFPLRIGIQVSFSQFQYLLVGLMEGLLITVAWLWSIRSSHKLAGPVYAFGREMKKLADGDLTVQVVLRPGDAFQETAEEINSGIASLRARIVEIKTLVVKLQSSDDEQSASYMQQLLKELDLLTTEKQDVQSH